MHYIAMSGLKGCLPLFLSVHDDPISAADDITELHDLDLHLFATLRDKSYVDLSINKHGAEYASVTECSCQHPEHHCEN